MEITPGPQSELRRRSKKKVTENNNDSCLHELNKSSNMTNVDETSHRVQYKNILLTDKSSKVGLFSLTGALIVLLCVCCEIGKQISNYSINYYNGGKYPIPQTVLVVLLEILKLSATVLRLKCKPPSFDKASVKASFKFLLPSVIYAVNNNIYLAGLILVPPPIWIILCSFRTFVTTLLYKFVLRREVTNIQFLGSTLIVMSIVCAKLGDLLSSDGGNSIPVLAIVFAVVSSFNSVGVSVYQEQLFKNSGENFLDQQFWLYFYGMIVATVVHLISAPNTLPSQILSQLSSASAKVHFFLVLGLIFSSVGGLVVAAVLKKLDNVVKEYSSATANMFTAVISATLFPDKFKITVFILLAMFLLFSGIFLYEKKTLNKSKPVTDNNNTDRKPLVDDADNDEEK